MDETHHISRKIVVVGSGDIGKNLTLELSKMFPDDHIVLANRDSDTATGAALSVDQSTSLLHKRRRGGIVSGKGSFTFERDNLKAAMDSADIVIVTAGEARKNDQQSRTDLAEKNISVIKPVADAVCDLQKEGHNKNTNWVIATNPVDLMAQYFQEESGANQAQIIGLSGGLDAERLEQSIRLNLHADYEEIRGVRVLGDHGAGMTPIFSGIELKRDGKWQKLTDVPEFREHEQEIEAAFTKATKGGGGLLAKLMGKSDGHAPADALANLVENIYDARFGNKEEAQPVTGSIFLPEHNIYSGGTVKFNEDGTHSPANTSELSEKEKTLLDAAYTKMRTEQLAFDNLAARFDLLGNKGPNTTALY